MELVDGVALTRVAAGGALPLDRVLDYARQIAGALAASHAANIVHRDIKPANILLNRKGELWVADFGMADVQGRDGLTLTGDLPGTLLTRSQAAGGKRLEVNASTPRGGALTAELVSGGKPVPGFGREDCVPFQGDATAAAIRWKGGDRCPAETVQLRLHLQRARLYGFEWKAQ